MRGMGGDEGEFPACARVKRPREDQRKALAAAAISASETLSWWVDDDGDGGGGGGGGRAAAARRGDAVVGLRPTARVGRRRGSRSSAATPRRAQSRLERRSLRTWLSVIAERARRRG